MVRLKDIDGMDVPFDSLIFQFHYGTIKSTLAESDNINGTNFNSTMVRLKDTENKTYLYINLQFQFHYGTIKSFNALFVHC